MASANTTATHKFVIILNEKSPVGKLLSATGQLAMGLYTQATQEQRASMTMVPFNGPDGINLVTLSCCSFVVLAGSGNQLRTAFTKAQEQGVLSCLFTSTMSYNGVEEDLIQKTASSPLDQVEPYGVGLFGSIEDLTPLTKKFSIYR